MPANTLDEPRRRQVFLSFAHDDRRVADMVAEALRDAGLRVWFDAWELAVGDSIAVRIDRAIASSDIILVLLSKHSVVSQWVRHELGSALSAELRDRAVTVIPALIEDCDIPPVLADRNYLDLRKDLAAGIQRLVRQLRAASDLDFSKLDAGSFEEMVGTLLDSLGFLVQRPLINRDVDFIASYRSRDPFGAEETTVWFVEVKFYRDQRVSITSLRQMLRALALAGGGRRGLVVTNGRLTSVARTFLAESKEKSGREIRVIDGTELVSLLIQYPEVVNRYFLRDVCHD